MIERIWAVYVLDAVRIMGERARKRAVVERIGVVLERIVIEARDQVFQDVRIVFGDVRCLGRICLDVEQEPIVEIDLFPGGWSEAIFHLPLM